MGTIQPFNVDKMRVKASERIHGDVQRSPVIVVKYKSTFAEGYCQYQDGVTAFFTVWYRDLTVRPSETESYGQHDRAMAYIQSITL